MSSAAEMSEVVRRAYDAFNRRDVAAFCELSEPGKMKEIRFFGDPDDALTAAGLQQHDAG